ncbi:MAG: dimethylallyltranstransferase [Candidatus Xenolissoclinum pacificiensis L6]|uniref:Dimethylallyltranstransferase n=1 Tax=Candidatus Xenolissoclinum pacificiensis L6 TaxID=1401685 RepID=W2V1V3_9RICK|nr:MAG: dimethylallyltranstransferase [Candidatus Xenolissoclinum pacificiensis L6]
MNSSDLNQYIEYELHKMNELITDITKTNVDTINKVLQYFLSDKGKQLRPILTIIFHRIFAINSSANNHLTKLVTTIELIHLATLLHDDVIDENDFRRNKSTVNACWNNNISVLSGDYLLSIAFSLVTSCSRIDIIRILSNTTSKLVLGEFKQLEKKELRSLSYDQYLDVISCKTASLFGAACQVGAMLAHSDENHANISYDFGFNLGIAFQMIDDLLDYIGNKQFNKNIGNDFFEQKTTLPIILLLQQCSESEKQSIITGFKARDIHNFQVIKEYMLTYNISSEILKLATEYIKQAQEAIKKITMEPYIAGCIEDMMNKLLHRLY